MKLSIHIFKKIKQPKIVSGTNKTAFSLLVVSSFLTGIQAAEPQRMKLEVVTSLYSSALNDMKDLEYEKALSKIPVLIEQFGFYADIDSRYKDAIERLEFNRIICLVETDRAEDGNNAIDFYLANFPEGRHREEVNKLKRSKPDVESADQRSKPTPKTSDFLTRDETLAAFVTVNADSIQKTEEAQKVRDNGEVSSKPANPGDASEAIQLYEELKTFEVP